MPKRKPWLGVREAAQLIKRYLGVSVGAALPIVCSAGDSGEVRSRHDLGWGPKPLAARVWAGAEIDPEGSIATGGDGHHYPVVEINAEDLQHWLEQNHSWLRPNPRNSEAMQADASAPRPLSKPDGKPASLPNRRRGPAPGTVNRFGEADLKLHSELKTLMQGPPKMSVSAAALELAHEQGKVAGSGSPKSRASRLANSYRKKNGH